jgi:hypothetical protein
MELEEIFLQLAPEHIAYVKFIFESYEEVGIIRTVDRKKAIIVLLAMRDFRATAQEILAALKQEVPLAEIPRPAEMNDDWFMAELAEASAGS